MRVSSDGGTVFKAVIVELWYLLQLLVELRCTQSSVSTKFDLGRCLRNTSPLEACVLHYNTSVHPTNKHMGMMTLHVRTNLFDWFWNTTALQTARAIPAVGHSSRRGCGSWMHCETCALTQNCFKLQRETICQVSCNIGPAQEQISNLALHLLRC